MSPKNNQQSSLFLLRISAGGVQIAKRHQGEVNNVGRPNSEMSSTQSNASSTHFASREGNMRCGRGIIAQISRRATWRRRGGRRIEGLDERACVASSRALEQLCIEITKSSSARRCRSVIQSRLGENFVLLRNSRILSSHLIKPNAKSPEIKRSFGKHPYINEARAKLLREAFSNGDYGRL